MEFAWVKFVPNRSFRLLMTPESVRCIQELRMFIYKFSMQDVLLVIAGGALGSFLRYCVTLISHYQTSSPFPYKTLIINVIGCFLVGFLAMRFQHHANHQMIRLFFITGFLGAFTTFSAFSYETVILYQTGHVKTALLNILASTFSGVLAVVAGMWIGITMR
jgi:CrcB protein